MAPEVAEVAGNEYHLRIEVISKPTHKTGILLKKYPYPVQNIPFQYGYRITNIGNKPFPGCLIKSSTIKSQTESFHCKTNQEYSVRALNTQESVDIDIDKITYCSKGAAWIDLELTPPSDDSIIHTYQYDKNHKKDDLFENPNKWGNVCFIQGELELLQHKTNNLILILTIMTAVDSIFSLKNILQRVASISSRFFYFLAELLKNVAT